MKTKEKLERAGYLYKKTEYIIDYYHRGGVIVLIDSKSEEAIAYYIEGSNQLIFINDEILEDLLCQ